MLNSKNLFRILCGALVLALTYAVCLLLVNNVFIENNYNISDAEYGIAGRIGWLCPLVIFPIYIIWLALINHSVSIGHPIYRHILLILITFALAFIAGVCITGITFAWVLSSVTSMLAAIFVSSIIETVGMAIASIVFRPR